MLIETQVVRSKSELLKELQRIPIAKAVVYRSVDKKAWEQIAREHPSATFIVVVL